MEHHEPKKIKSKRLQKVLQKMSNPNLDKSINDETAHETNKQKRQRGGPKQKSTALNGGGVNNSDSKVKGQVGKKNTRNVSSGAADGSESDGSDGYVPATKVVKADKGQVRRSGRANKKVVENMDKDNQEENEKDRGVSTVAKDSRNGASSTKDVRGSLRGVKGASRGRGANNKGRGKGRVGVRGKGKALAKHGRGRGSGEGVRVSVDQVTFTGPNLSESSSDDSD